MIQVEPYVHRISIVIPVYMGELTLMALVDEITKLGSLAETPRGNKMTVEEIVLVYDNGPDNSDDVIRDLEAENPLVRCLWLTRNFGQHAATLAGMAVSSGDWIVTMDEDGQHNPADIPALLDVALDQRVHVVYAAPTNRPPHSVVRTAMSHTAKRILALVFSDKRSAPIDYQSFRLILGQVGRSVAASAGSGIYLDVALGWITNRIGTSPITLREEGRKASGYSYRSLAGHFWRMILTSGTRGLRLVSILGALLALAGVLLATFFLIQRLTGGNLPQGWTSMVMVTLVSSGAILISLGVIAEYIGVSVNMALGKPLYMVMDDPSKGPLGRRSTT